MNDEAKSAIAEQLDAATLPEVHAAMNALAGQGRRFSLLIWDDESEAAVVLSNSHPRGLVDMLRQTADRVAEKSKHIDDEVKASKVRH